MVEQENLSMPKSQIDSESVVISELMICHLHLILLLRQNNLFLQKIIMQKLYDTIDQAYQKRKENLTPEIEQLKSQQK